MNPNKDKINWKNIRTMVERLVPYDELVPNIYLGTTFCPYHPNHKTPSAKYYLDEDGIIRLRCFAEHRTYTSYDYLKLIMGVNPFKYLENQFGKDYLESMVEHLNKYEYLSDFADEEKILKVDNLWVDSLENFDIFLDSIYDGIYLK